MATKTQQEIEELLTNKLEKGEEFLLIGSSTQGKNSSFIWQDRQSMIVLAIITAIFFYIMFMDRITKGANSIEAIQFALAVAIPAIILSLILPIRKTRFPNLQHYAISTKRFFIYEDNSLNSYSLYRFTDIIVSKAKDGFSDVSLYTGNTISGALAD